MAMLPEYYPGDSYEEYLRMLAEMGNPTDVFARSLSPFTRPQSIPSFGAIPGFQYNDYLGADPTRGLRISSFKKDFPKSQKVDNPGATFPLNQTIEEDPITVLRRNTDRARNYPKDFSEMFNPSLNPEGDIINFRRMNTDRARNYQRDSDYLPGKQTPPQQAQGPARPASDTSSFNYNIPAVPKTPAPAQAQSAPAQGGGLLDVDTDFFDDPTRMGLLQAGLGLMSAPRYSTNPNDVTLSSALARGLGGYIQGYGGTKKRLSEEERQKIEDEYKRSQIEFDKLYKTALTNEAIGRTEQMKALLAKPAKDQKEWEAKVREIYPNPDNKTGQALIAAGPIEGAKKLAKLAGGMTETERKNLVEGIKKNPDLTDSEKAILIEMAGERNYEGNLANSSVAITNQMDDYVKQKNPDKPSDLNDGVMYSRLERGRRDPKYVETPEYAEAYGRYKDKALRPSLSQSGTATYIPSSTYPAPEGMEAQTGTSALSKVTQTPTGVQINQMNPDDSKEVRTLFSNIQKLEEFEKIVQNVDLNNMDRITSDSPEVARLSTIYNDLLLRLKEQPYNLGVITGPDMDLMESILDNPAKADPTNIRAFFRDKDYYLAKINQLRGILINDTQNVLQDYGGDVNQAYEQRFQRPLTWIPKTPPKTSRTSPKTKEILNQVEQPPAVAPVPNNGNESSLIDFLPDPIQNIFR